VARGYWRDRPRPVLLNNWEATGMEFTEDSIVEIAKKGAEVGVELFVLDDGWFGKRTETSGLGDWYVDKSKLPNGVKGLADRINGLGLKFGIWIEPEMANPDSDLFRAHPDYVLAAPGRRKSLGRNQMVLDYSNPRVIDYIYDQLMESFKDVDLAYIKWDMNCSITECYSAHWPADQQGEVYHRYILGVYSLYERLIKKFPNLLFESCASGGCRFDAGMLYYAPQAWCSDDTDAIERINIQYGSSYGYPISSWGAHVSEVPNQQTSRITSLRTRANVAYFGAFGYEMDLNQMNAGEIEAVKEQVKFMKEHRELIQFGDFYRLSSPFSNEYASWMVVSPDKKEAIVGVYLLASTPNVGFKQIKLQGLNADFDYVIDEELVRGGDDLMEFGLIPVNIASHPIDASRGVLKKVDLVGEYDSKLYHLKAKNYNVIDI
ncbi:MAG: alpha-galactosidase, partial [Lachnospiraceae bacterium]|nr:alpha-galactosidase [Lachnospiraceae bacterium]